MGGMIPVCPLKHTTGTSCWAPPHLASLSKRERFHKREGIALNPEVFNSSPSECFKGEKAFPLQSSHPPVQAEQAGSLQCRIQR